MDEIKANLVDADSTGVNVADEYEMQMAEDYAEGLGSLLSEEPDILMSCGLDETDTVITTEPDTSTDVEVAEESTTNLLSDSVDDFICKPNTEAYVKRAVPQASERNVCVAVNVLDCDQRLLKSLMNKLSHMCATNQTVTDTHRVALLVLFKEPNKLNRLGFCDELTASNLVYSICNLSGVAACIYRDYDTASERLLTEEDLGKRPFRF